MNIRVTRHPLIAIRNHWTSFKIYRSWYFRVLLDSLVRKICIKSNPPLVDISFKSSHETSDLPKLHKFLIENMSRKIDAPSNYFSEFLDIFKSISRTSKHVSGIKLLPAYVLFLLIRNSKFTKYGETGFQTGRSALLALKTLQLNNSKFEIISSDIVKRTIPIELLESNFKLITIRNFRKELPRILELSNPQIWFLDGDNRYLIQHF